MAVLPTPASPKQHRIVLRAAAENLDGPFDFLLAADHRVELPLAGEFGEIAAEAVERGSLALARLAAFAFAFFATGFADATAARATLRPPGRGPAG